jgi:hypothetical protein
MRALDIIWFLLDLVTFAVWLFCMVSWVRGGATFPRWVHLLALVLTASGIIAGIVAYLSVGLTFQAALTCLLLPSALTYAGWLWLFGPWARRESD